MWIWQIVRLLIFRLLIAPLVIWLVWDAQCFTLWRAGSNASSTTRPSKAPRPLKPRTPDVCPVCRHQPPDAATEQAANAAEPVALTPYAQVKSPRGRKKLLSTAGFACSNPHCLYFGMTDDRIHSLVHCGNHGRHERIADLKCQACGRKFSMRFGTALYRLKTARCASRVAMVLTALAEGVGIAAAARIFGHSEFTLQTWLTRAGLHAQSLHQRLLRGLHLGHVQLDEVRTAVRQGAQIVWVWIALDARSKLVAAMHIGPRTQDFAHALVHGAECATSKTPSPLTAFPSSLAMVSCSTSTP
jgi:transposase-like protein